MRIETIDIHNNESGQTIQLPEEFRINDEKVYLKKTGNVVHLIPYNQPWQNLFESLEEFTDDFMNERNQPLVQNRELFD